METSVNIREGSIDELAAVNHQIVEFDTPYEVDEFRRRLKVPHLGLIAEEDGRLLGFKVGYELDSRVFYSWMGGVLPDARGKGIARALLKKQEDWVRASGYTEIRVKSRNRYTGMLNLLLVESYLIVSVELQDDPRENRIWFSKRF